MKRLNFQELLNFPGLLTERLPNDIEKLSSEEMRGVIHNSYFAIFFYAKILNQLSEAIFSMKRWNDSEVFPKAFKTLVVVSKNDKQRIEDAIKKMDLKRIPNVPMHLIWQFEERGEK